MRAVSTIHLALTALLAVMLAAASVLPVQALELKPYKDDLFGYPGVLEKRDNGDFLSIDYRKPRDIYERDVQPLVKVKPEYVNKWVNWHQSFDTLDLGGRKLDVFSVGKIGSQRFSVIFIHGRGVDRLLAANDDRFGGNFNRLKNLAYDNGGVYIAPSIKSFDEGGLTDVARLIAYMRKSSGGRPVILACASMGSIMCHGIARDPKSVAMLSGMVLMAGVYDPDFMSTPFYTAHVPVLFAHGTLDEVYSWKDQAGLYDALKKKNYPARFVLFNTGKHGTPLRMLDWRDTLNWFLK
jgi:hypothetical protein